MEDTIKIVCPHCGHEYLPVEIFIPEEFFGRPTEVIRDPAGRIDFFLGKGMNLNETYICDSCGTNLRITAKMSFDVEPINGEDDEDYETKIERPTKLKLDEVDLFDTDTREAE